MVGSPKLITKRCYRCSSGIQMPDGSAWCGITKKPESAIGCLYTPGIIKLYEPEPKVVQKEKVVVKTTPIPKVEPIPTEQKPVIISKKTKPEQKRLF